MLLIPMPMRHAFHASHHVSYSPHAHSDHALLHKKHLLLHHAELLHRRLDGRGKRSPRRYIHQLDHVGWCPRVTFISSYCVEYVP